MDWEENVKSESDSPNDRNSPHVVGGHNSIVSASLAWGKDNKEFVGLVIAVLGVLLYAILRFVYSIFYGSLGLKPEDVGLGYGELVSQSIVGLIFIYLICATPLAVFFGWLVSVGVRLSRNPTMKRGRIPEWILIPSVTLLAAYCVLTGLYSRSVPGWLVFSADPKLALTEGITLTFLLLILLYARFVHRIVVRFKIAATVLAFLLPTLITFGVLTFFANSARTAVHQGHSVRRWTGSMPTLLAWSAEPADVYWAASAPPELRARSSHCLMYLGEANQTAVFYDVQAQDTLRVPTNSVTIDIHPERRKC